MRDVRCRRGLAVALALIAMLSLGQPASAAALAPGSEGSQVLALQHRLSALGLYRGPLDGKYGHMTEQSVMAFHKYLGLDRSFAWSEDDWRYLTGFQAPIPFPDDRLVIDLDRQLLYVHLAGEVAIMPISSASGEMYRGRAGRLVRARTPEGDFTLYRHVDGMRRSYLGELWRPWYFRGGYAIHGSGSVPGYPASHGCVRVPNWEANWLNDRLELGIAVTVGRWGVERPPPLPPPAEPGIRHTPAGPVDDAGRLVS